ncbi:MAG: NADP-dependent isocitrate dehydrogenase [Gemmatimonadota bacterium]|nr:NADP-dependent isocitrate dehydrogenase [Gemmatimonadota bacterium]
MRSTTPRHPECPAQLDVVVIRENEEDTYAGIEHRQTTEVTQCLKLITRPGCERIARYAFTWARANGRRKVTCMTKDNIMKLTDGLFRQVAEEVAQDYPDLAYEHLIVDIGAARLADTPEDFDVVLVPNLYGDILSDVVAQLAGSVGLAGSANIGVECAMFEAIHGSAPAIAGRNVANPTGLLNAAAMMLRHVGQPGVAIRVENALLRTIEDGIHTQDIYTEGQSGRLVGTQEFADAVIERLGLVPAVLSAARAAGEPVPAVTTPTGTPRRPHKELVGVDVFVDWDAPRRDANELSARLRALVADDLRLTMITNRGVKVWPERHAATFCTDHWRCRFVGGTGNPVTPAAVANALLRLAYAGIDVVKTENLYTFDGRPGYSLGQGE